MSKWHQDIQYGVFDSMIAEPEAKVPGARIDVLLHFPRRKVAVEIQHSPIDMADVERRHAAHRDAGIAATLWIADVAGRAERRPVRGDPAALVTSSPWVLDLLDLARSHRDAKHHVVVALAAPDLDGRCGVVGDRRVGDDQMAMVSRVAISRSQGAAAVERPVVWPLSVLGAWATSMVPSQMRTPVEESALRSLAQVHRARVKRPKLLGARVRCDDGVLTVTLPQHHAEAGGWLFEVGLVRLPESPGVAYRGPATLEACSVLKSRLGLAVDAA